MRGQFSCLITAGNKCPSDTALALRSSLLFSSNYIGQEDARAVGVVTFSNTPVFPEASQTPTLSRTWGLHNTARWCTFSTEPDLPGDCKIPNAFKWLKSQFSSTAFWFLQISALKIQKASICVPCMLPANGASLKWCPERDDLSA